MTGLPQPVGVQALVPPCGPSALALTRPTALWPRCAPHDYRRGSDPQLAKALQVVLAQLKQWREKHPPPDFAKAKAASGGTAQGRQVAGSLV